MSTIHIPEHIGDLPSISGHEQAVAQAMAQPGPYYLPSSGINFGESGEKGIQSCFAIALHMHQPLVPAGGDDLTTARVISNLQDMFEHPGVGDNHNAGVFHWCYKRMGEMIPRLVDQGASPRVMLDYSGTLLHGLRQMGLHDVFDHLQRITCDPRYSRCVEWLGSAWGHPVAPSTPVQDYRLHVQAWQQHFAGIFGLDALKRVRGFSPAEMALPNHPDVCYEFVRILKDSGYRWVLVQEHTVERPEDGQGVHDPHVPHRLVARNSRGETASIVAIIKTQGSDTKLVAQMQPYHEAVGLSRATLAGRSIPRLVTQISDGENGGVMMNEFPDLYQTTMAQASGTTTPPVNVSEYLEYLESLGISEEDLPTVQPAMQKRIWDRFEPNGDTRRLGEVIRQLTREDARFHVDGGSWTNNISWVKGYEDVLKPMEQVSAMFSQKVLERQVPPTDPRYRNALYHLLMTQTSCYRYWGEGMWTDYGRELCRRTRDILKYDL